MKVLSLFSGIGAFEKALDRLEVSYELVNYCEIDKYAAKAYSMIHGCSEEKNLGDITKVDTSKLPSDIDLTTYGFPCQDISLAGKQRGFEAEGERTRSGLFFEALRIIEDVKPRIAIAENVKNLTSKKFKKEFDIVLSSLEQAGYNNYWQVLNAKDYGIPQNRERVFIVSIRKDVDNGMFEFPDPFELELRLKDMLENEVDEKYYLSQELTEKIRYRLGDKEYNLLGGMQKNQSVKEDGISTTLTSSMGAGGGYVPMINEPVRKYGIFDDEKGKHQAGSVWETEGLAPTLDTMQGGYRQPCIEIKEKTKKGYKEAYERDGIYLDRPHQKRGCVQHGMVQTLKTSGNDVGVVTKSLRIRKLTPLECFRLMGFGDEDFNKIVGISNTQLYKMAGNSIVVNVLVHLFKSLFEALETNEHKEIIEQPALFEIDRGEVIMVGIKEEKQTNGSMIKWNEIDSLIGKPVFDKGNEMWRVLAGYKRIADEFFVAFTDYDGFEDIDLNCTNLYRNEEMAYKNSY